MYYFLDFLYLLLSFLVLPIALSYVFCAIPRYQKLKIPQRTFGTFLLYALVVIFFPVIISMITEGVDYFWTFFFSLSEGGILRISQIILPLFFAIPIIYVEHAYIDAWGGLQTISYKRESLNVLFALLLSEFFAILVVVLVKLIPIKVELAGPFDGFILSAYIQSIEFLLMLCGWVYFRHRQIRKILPPS
jgi:hypothetical protein